MPATERRIDWRLPAVWAVLFAVSIATRTYVAVADEAVVGWVADCGAPASEGG